MNKWREIQRMPRSEQRAMQDHLLRRYVSEYLQPFSAFYRELFARAGVSPDQIRTVDDLRRLPLTSKIDLLPSKEDPQRFKKFILQPDPVSLKAAWPLHKKLPLLWQKWTKGTAAVKQRLRTEFYPSFMTFTTGRSAEPVPFFYTPHDLANLRETGARLVDVMGLHSEFRVANVFPYAPHLAFWQVFSAGQATGMMVLSTGGGKVMGSSGDLRAIARLRAEALIGVPGYIYHLLRRGAAEGIDLSSIKIVVLGAERVPPGMKLKIRSLLAQMGAKDVRVFGTYGFTEARMAFAECPTQDNEYTGYHLYPDLAIFEVVDPKTGEVVPDGCDGELVFSPLQARASCVFRYRTGDLVRGGIRYEPCPHCGRTVPRISSDLTRESSLKDLQLLKIKGTLVNLEDCAMLLGSMPEIEEWQIELRKKDDDPLEVDELIVHLALRDDEQREAAATKVRETFKGRLEVAPNRVEFLGLEAMLRKIGMETEMKEKRFVDARPKP
ncbi:MAG: phenylacetate--CoA ligase family protein [Planctomycetes bacterium]|nr:phenylacetate--CoA ligase family protein [Planctomycetota bacterium]